MLRWTKDDRPCLNTWYRVINGHKLAYWKIMKDYHNPRMGRTYYKVVDYYNGDIICCGKSLHYCRDIIRENTYKKGYDA